MSATAPGFRQSNVWLHTWSGIVIGWLLYLIFFSGALSFFRSEINIWAQPELEQITPQQDAQSWRNAIHYLQQSAPNSPVWNISLPSERNPALYLRWFDEGEEPSKRGGHRAMLDPASGEVITPRETRIGDFLYRLHFELYGMPREVARWIIGIATMAMLVGLITGIIIHKKIFKDFFTFRPHKGQRSWMDMHNVSSVLALPFHLMITFSGLLLLMYLLMPWGVQSAYDGDMRKYFEASGGRGGGMTLVDMPVAEGLNGNLSLIEQTQALMSLAEVNWPRGVDSLQVVDPSGSPSIALEQKGADSLLNRARSQSLVFKPAMPSLQLEKSQEDIGFWRGFYNSFTALHLLRYADALPRWLFFLGGILGCIMVATGLMLWIEKRRQKTEKTGEWQRMYRLVQRLNVTAIIGLPLATVVALWANRLLPVELAQRELWEIRLFFMAWLVSLIYSFIRSNRQAWQEQLVMLSGLLLLLPLYNLVMIPGYSVISLSMDAVLIVFGVLAALTFRRLLGHQNSRSVAASRKSNLLRSMS